MGSNLSKNELGIRERKIIDNLTYYFQNNLTMSENLDTKLLAVGLLTAGTLEELNVTQTISVKVKILCSALKRRGPNALLTFVHCLQETGNEHVADEILRHLNGANCVVSEPQQTNAASTLGTAENSTFSASPDKSDRFNPRQVDPSQSILHSANNLPTTAQCTSSSQDSQLQVSHSSQVNTSTNAGHSSTPHESTGFSLTTLPNPREVSGYFSAETSSYQQIYGLLEERILSLEERFQPVEVDMQDVKSQVAHNEERIQELENKLKEAHKEIERYQKEAAENQEIIKTMQAALEHLQREKTELERKNTQLQRQLSKSRDDLDKTKRQQEEASRSLQKANQNNRSLKEENNRIRRRLVRLRNENASANHASRMRPKHATTRAEANHAA